MNKLQKPAYKSPGLKTINLTPRISVCQTSLLGDEIRIDDLLPSDDPIDIGGLGGIL